MPARYRSSIWSTNISVAPNRPVVKDARPPMASISGALSSVPASVSVRRHACVLLVPQQQRIDDGVAEFADADLQGAGIAHQAAGVQSDGVIHRGQRRVRRREQIVVVARMIQQQVEGVGADIGGAQHEGHLAMHLAEQHHRAAGGAQSRDVRQQVHRDIGIAAQADFGDSAHHAPRDHVRDHVDAAMQELARHVRVVCREIVRLRVRRVEQRARLEEELDHARVGGHGAVAHGLEVIELGIVAEDARRQRLDEALLEIARAGGLAQRQRGEDREVQAAIGPRAAEEFVGDEIGLADAERQRQHHLPAHAPQRLFDYFSDVIKHLRHGVTLACAQTGINADEPLETRTRSPVARTAHRLRISRALSFARAAA